MKKLFKRSERGLAMPELLVAITVILVVLTASAFVLVNSLRNQTDNEVRDRAVQVVRDEIERARALSFDELSLNDKDLLESKGNLVYDYTMVSDPGEKELIKRVYTETPIVNAVINNGQLEPWGRPDISLAERGDEGGEGEELTEYFIRRDVTYYPDAPEDTNKDGKISTKEEGYTSKEVTITTYWKKGDKVDSTSMSWIRTPSVSDRNPDEAVVGEDIILNAPTNVSYTYDALGKNMDIFWYFSQTGVSERDLEFEIFLGTPTNMKQVRTAPGAARMVGNVPVAGATHLFVRAVYRGAETESEVIALSSPTVITAPEAPVISGTQLAGTTTARFSFAPVSQATVYTARYRINEQNWITIGELSPNSNWTSPEMDAGGKIEFSVFAANVAGSSPVAVRPVNMVGKPASPVIDEPKQRMTNAMFTFSAGEGADSYRAQYRINDGNWVNVSNPRARQEITVNGQSDGNVVHFRVASFSNISGLGEYSTTSYQILPPPAEPEIYLSEQRPGQAVFGFAVSPNADTYEASYRVAGGSWRALNDAVPGEEIVLDWTASKDETYEFRVRAHSESAGSSGYSQTSLDLLTPPAAPTFTSATQSGQEARFIFGSVARSQGYLAEYRIGEDGEWTNIPNATPDTTMRVESSGANGEVIEVRVQAINSTTGNSNYGTRSLTMVGKPEVPEFSRSEQVDRDAVFVFDASERADSYRVEYQVGANGEWKNWSSPRPGTAISIRGTGAQQESVTVRVWASNIAGETDNFGEATVTLVVPPEPPKIVKSVQSKMNAIFTFEQPIGADSYVAQYRLAGGSWVDIDLNDYLPEPPEPGSSDDPGAVAPLEDVTVTLPALAGIKVDFRVKAVNNAGESAFSNASVTMIPPPAAPVISKSVQELGRAVFVYDSVSGAASYEASYRFGSSGSWTTTNVAPGTEFKAFANVGQRVEFRVRALNVAGESEYTQSSVTMIAPPATPNITKSAQEGNKAVFSFGTVPTADSYVAQYKLNDGAWTNASATPGSDFSVTAGGGQTVEFRVKAVNVGGDSSYATSKVELVYPPAEPTITKNVQVLGQAVFAYSSVVGADSYVAEYRVATGNWTVANVAPETDFKVNANAGQKVEFRVKARNAAGDSALVTSSVTMIAPPATPVIKSSAQVGMTARIIFYASARATSYEAEYRIDNGAWTSRTAAPGTNINISATAGQTVEFRVKAVNIAGESEFANADAVTLIPVSAVPTITRNEQVGMEAVFDFSAVATATSYSGRYQIAGGPWQDTVTGLTPGTPVKVAAAGGQKVNFQVRSTNIAGTSSYSASKSVDMVGIPAVPSVTTNVQDGNKATFVYGSVASADSYESDYRIGTGSWVNVSSTPGNTVSVSASTGQKVEFRVRAVNAAGASEYGTADVTMIAAPAAPKVTGSQVGAQARFSFASVSGATSYVAEYQIGTGAWTKVSLNPGTNYSVSASAPATVNFRVTAQNVAGESTGTASVDLVPSPAAPQFSLTSKSTNNNALVRYTDVQYATGYELQVQRDGGTWTNITGHNPNANVTVPYNGADILAFRVRAQNIAGWSPYRETSLVVMDAPATPAWTTTEQTSQGNGRFIFGSSVRATAYEAQYRVNNSSWYQLPAENTVPDQAFTISGTRGSTIEVRVRALNIGGASDWSHTSLYIVGRPDAPTWTRADRSGANAILAYSSSTNATSYTVEINRGDGNWVTVGSTKPNEAFPVAGNGSSQIFLRVRANNVAGSSDYATTDVILVSAPAAPKVLTSEQQNASFARFSYGPVATAESYTVQYRINSGSWVTTDQGPDVLRSYGANPGDKVDYQVRANNVAGSSGWATATVQMEPVPTALTVSGVATSTTQANFSWNLSSVANKYEYQYRCGTGSWSSIITGTDLTGRNVVCGVAETAQLQVRVSNISGTSPWASATVNLPAPVPTVPNVTGSSTSTTRASFSWPAVTWATSYNYQTLCANGTWSTSTSTTSRSAALTCASGATAEIRVQAVNASGASAWATASVDLPAPSAEPVVTISNVSTTSGSITWTAVTGATSYEYRTLRNDGAWGSWTARSTRSLTVSSGYNEGDLIGIQVRATNARGAGPEKTVAINLLISHPQVNGWIIESNSAKNTLYYQLINKYEQRICPVGTVMQTRYRDVVKGRTWDGRNWSGWVTKSGSPYWSGNSHTSGTTGSTIVTQEQEIRCQNPATGNLGTTEWATIDGSHTLTPFRSKP